MFSCYLPMRVRVLASRYARIRAPARALKYSYVVIEYFRITNVILKELL